MELDEQNAIVVVSGAPESIGEIVSVNSRTLSLLGLQRITTIGRNIGSMFPGACGEWLLAQLKGAVSSAWCLVCSFFRDMLILL